ncbi:MAG: hypothetical protein WCN95_10370 [bacterium]
MKNSTEMILAGLLLAAGCTTHSRQPVTAVEMTSVPVFALDTQADPVSEGVYWIEISDARQSYRIMWDQSAVRLSTNQAYRFELESIPAWEKYGGAEPCPGGTWPPGFVKRILDGNTVVWEDPYWQGYSVEYGTAGPP